MNWKDGIQIASWLGGTALSLVSIVSVILAIRQYRRNTRQRVAQSLMELEERLETHWEIMPIIDPASKRYDSELRHAVQNSLEDMPQLNRQPEDRKLIVQLDQFLRFLLLLSSLERYELLNREALDYMYSYWFAAVYLKNGHLRVYIEKYFPTLNSLLSDRFAATKDESPGKNSNR
jgi:hypothetical protein